MRRAFLRMRIVVVHMDENHFRCLYKCFRQVFVPSTKPIKEFLESEWPPNQSIEEWVQNLSTLAYQEIEWRAPWMIRSTVLIGCGGHLWVPLIGIWGVVTYSSLMVLSQYGYDQCVPAIAGLKKVEALVQDSSFWKKFQEIRIKWGQTLSLESRTFFNHSSSETYIQWFLKRSKISVSAQFKGKIKVPDDVAELTEKIHDLDMCLRVRDEEVRWQREKYQEYIQRLEVDPSPRANELQKARKQERTWRRVSNEKTVEIEVLDEEICHLTKELRTKQRGAKQRGHKRIYGACGAIYYGGTNDSKPTRGVCNNAHGRNKSTMKLLEVAQVHYQKFIKLMRRKKKNDE
ncbi:hypothetical protein GOBAR_AA23193 [Gossypium barbadense]|uniref:DUF7745 domain-containing protein n=1 Tax=Gossypium barbadense TaxID=3634 RepID=A0A2P5X2B1_GOSBA|nr:hypothetical protein GOBAR_AA23193 [Gossypium barbadense]